jgi:hypothetical protein
MSSSACTFQFKGMTAADKAPPLAPGDNGSGMTATAQKLGLSPTQMFPILLVEGFFIGLLVAAIWSAVWYLRKRYKTPDPGAAQGEGLPQAIRRKTHESADAAAVETHGSAGAAAAAEDEEAPSSMVASAKSAASRAKEAKAQLDKATGGQLAAMAHGAASLLPHHSSAPAAADDTGEPSAGAELKSDAKMLLSKAKGLKEKLLLVRDAIKEDYKHGEDTAHRSGLTLCCWFLDKFYMPLVTATAYHIVAVRAMPCSARCSLPLHTCCPLTLPPPPVACAPHCQVFAMSNTPAVYYVTCSIAAVLLYACFLWIAVLWKLLEPVHPGTELRERRAVLGAEAPPVAGNAYAALGDDGPGSSELQDGAEQDGGGAEQQDGAGDHVYVALGDENASFATLLPKRKAGKGGRPPLLSSFWKALHEEPFHQTRASLLVAASVTWAPKVTEPWALRIMACEFFLHRFLLGLSVGAFARAHQGQVAVSWLVNLAACFTSIVVSSPIDVGMLITLPGTATKTYTRTTMDPNTGVVSEWCVLGLRAAFYFFGHCANSPPRPSFALQHLHCHHEAKRHHQQPCRCAPGGPRCR